MNSFFSFNKYDFFKFVAADYCPKNVAFARKIMALPESGGGLQPSSPPGSYAYGLMEAYQPPSPRPERRLVSRGQQVYTVVPAELVKPPVS